MRDSITGYEEIFQQNRYPKTGEIVRCRKSGTLWRVMEREVWQKVEEDSLTGRNWIVPFFYFSFWRLQDGVPPRVGEMMGFLCHPDADDFADRWEVLCERSAGTVVRNPGASANMRLH